MKKAFLEEIVQKAKEVIAQKGEIDEKTLGSILEKKGLRVKQIISPGSATILNEAVDILLYQKVIRVTRWINDNIPVLSLTEEKAHRN